MFVLLEHEFKVNLDRTAQSETQIPLATLNTQSLKIETDFSRDCRLYLRLKESVILVGEYFYYSWFQMLACENIIL